MSKVYRNPTFNDLYWEPGGNINLKPESGWSNTLGINWEKYQEFKKLQLGANIFSNIIDDWIIWLPTSTNIWKPQNVRKVWARGLELNNYWTQHLGEISFHFQNTYGFTLSTNKKTSAQNQNILDKQLIYIPKNLLRTNLEVKYKTYFWFINYSYTGKRFTNSNNTSYLPAFHLVDFNLGKNTLIKNWNINTKLSINNILNTHYQLIAWRPMLGRNYIFELNIKSFADFAYDPNSL